MDSGRLDGCDFVSNDYHSGPSGLQSAPIYPEAIANPRNCTPDGKKKRSISSYGHVHSYASYLISNYLTPN